MERETGPSGKVVVMTGSDRGLGFRIAGEVRAYWEGLRNGRPVPARSDIDPRGIERALEYAFIIERIAPGMARFRLAGMHLNDLMGTEVRGMPLTSLFAPAARKRLGELLEGVFSDPGTAELQLTAESGIGKPALLARLLLLPLKSDLGDVSRALGCLVAEGPIGRSPRRFEVTSAQTGPVVAGTPSERGVPVPVAPLPAGFAESTPGFAGAAGPALPATPEARRALLRLVRSDD